MYFVFYSIYKCDFPPYKRIKYSRKTVLRNGSSTTWLPSFLVSLYLIHHTMSTAESIWCQKTGVTSS